MNKKIIIAVTALAVIVAGYFVVNRKPDAAAEIEFRYAPVVKGELTRSINATGLIVALTTVDVKSKAGGKILHLFVDEGSVVKKGDPIADIDPEDTQAAYDQANADLTTANARASQAEQNLQLQDETSRTEVAGALSALQAARTRLERVKIQTARQPQISNANVNSAQAAYDSELANYEKLDKVSIPQLSRDANGNFRQAKAQLDTAQADLTRQEGLLQKGYVAGSAVEKAQSVLASAQAAYDTAKQRIATINQDFAVSRRTEKLNVDRVKATLDQAIANSSDVAVGTQNLAEAREAVRTAQNDVIKARNNQMQIAIRRNDMLAARASTVRNQVSLKNAKVQLQSTTVLAPRDGVVTLKYLEEGTIIPPGTSTFAQGTSLVQLSDVTSLFVECAVDEADIGNCHIGQKVKVTIESYPGEKMDGEVTRVNPAAQTAQNITAVKVRLKLHPKKGINVLPGMNATCEFITLSRPGVLIAPTQAIKSGPDGSTVRIRSKDPKKPEVRKVEVGETGNDGVEIKSGLNEGDEVVTAEIDLQQLRDTQKKMEEANQGGGLAGGGPQGGRRPAQSRGATSAGGGARPGAGGGRPKG